MLQRRCQSGCSGNLRPSSVCAQQRFRHDREPATHPGEAAVLREAAELDRAFARARNLENRMRNLRVADVSLVGRIEEDDRLVLPRVVDPARQLRARSRPRRSDCWESKDKRDRHVPVGGSGTKSFSGRARQIDDPFVSARLVRRRRCVPPSHWYRRRPDKPDR